MIPVTAELAVRRPRAGFWASGPLGLAANLTPDWPPLQSFDWAALLATAIALVSVKARLGLPRLPTHVFYAFYPAHILALHFMDLYG